MPAKLSVAIMTHQLTIEVEPSTLRRSSKGVVTGAIWVRCNGIEFPEKGWNDFVIRVLGMWCESAMLLNSQHMKRPVDFPFMDGSFGFLIFPEVEKLAVRCYEDFAERRVIGECISSRNDLMRKVYNAASRVMRECEIMRWNDKELEEFQGMVALLQAKLSNYSGNYRVQERR
jgi:hypothetical protein